MRRRSALLLPAVLLAALAAPVGAQTPAAVPTTPPDAGGAVLNVLPPGSRGNVTVPQALAVGASRQATATTPTNYADQLEMYDALARTAPGELGEDLSAFYKDGAIDLPSGQEVSTLQPRPGVTIRRDRFGVPFVVGVTAEDVAYGAGYAGTEDRMFLTDLLRHVGAARTAEFLGGSAANLAMDVEQLRAAPYTREEAEAQIEAVLQRYPDEGPGLLRRLDAFLAGINDAQRALCPAAFGLPVGAVIGGELEVGVGLGPNCPVEYAALETPPTDFARADVVYVASLVGGIFGKGGGGEATNARWLQQLQRTFGDTEARRVYEDLRFRNDPEAPATATVPFPYEGATVDPTRPGAALPDLDGPTAPSTGSDAGGSQLPLPVPLPLRATGARPGVVDGPFGPMDLGLGGAGGSMSNALLVGADRTDTGHPLVVFGPQTGYFTPQLLTEVSLRGPGIAARGVSFTGTQLIVQLGHGVDYAWSATSASSDNVDTVVERLCSTTGGAVGLDADGYLLGTACTPFDSYVHEQTVIPTAAGTGPPAVVRMLVERTVHGVVQERTTVDGAPVAVVLDRSTYGQELDSAVGFARANDPDFVSDAGSFARAFAAVDYTFNWFYADDRDISYFSSGLLPVRAPGVDPDLPRWGDAAFDWRGFLPDAEHPQQTNPPTGYFSSWNNKQAPAFTAADGTWGYGPVYRSLLLDRRVQGLLAAGPVTRTALVEQVADAAVADLRAEVLLPLLLDVVGPPDDPALSPAVREAVAVLRAWTADPLREDRDRDGAYTRQAAIALFDQWWEPADPSLAVARTVLREGLGPLADELPKGLDDHPRLGLGSAWNGVAWYGYVSKELRAVLGRPVAGPFSRSYCGGLDACRAALRASLAGAVQRVLAEQGASSVAALTYDKSEDNIRPTTAGLVATREIDWQNRPTFQQVVSFSTSRRGASTAPLPAAAPAAPGTAAAAAPGGAAPGGAAPGGAAPGGAAPGGAAPGGAAPARRLADTGLPAAALLGVVLLAAGSALRRRPPC